MNSHPPTMLNIFAALAIAVPAAAGAAAGQSVGKPVGKPVEPSAETSIEPGAGVEKIEPAVARTKAYSARVLDLQDGQLRLTLPEIKEERTLHLDPELLRPLGKIADRTFTVTSSERRAPSGIVGALALRDQRGLYAVVESIRDQPLFRPEDRAGIEIQPLPGEGRTLVYESECAIVYNVPTAFIVGKQRYVLQAFESKEVKIDGAVYALSLQTSRWTVEKKCPAIFEGPRSQVDYTLVRKP